MLQTWFHRVFCMDAFYTQELKQLARDSLKAYLTDEVDPSDLYPADTRFLNDLPTIMNEHQAHSFLQWIDEAYPTYEIGATYWLVGILLERLRQAWNENEVEMVYSRFFTEWDQLISKACSEWFDICDDLSVVGNNLNSKIFWEQFFDGVNASDIDSLQKWLHETADRENMPKEYVDLTKLS